VPTYIREQSGWQTISRILYSAPHEAKRRSFIWASNFLEALAAYPETGRAVRGHPKAPVSLFGLAPCGVYQAGALPGRWCALTAPFHPYQLPGGMFSVALSVPYGPPSYEAHCPVEFGLSSRSSPRDHPSACQIKILCPSASSAIRLGALSGILVALPWSDA
jgi:hypothetical protein